MTDKHDGSRAPSLLQQVEGTEKLFLSGRRNREADLESAVRFFLEFLHGFESFDFDQPCVTVFGSARLGETTGTTRWRAASVARWPRQASPS